MNIHTMKDVMKIICSNKCNMMIFIMIKYTSYYILYYMYIFESLCKYKHKKILFLIFL